MPPPARRATRRRQHGGRRWGADRPRRPLDLMIREYDALPDRKALRTCVVELQDFERGLEPTLPKGEEMADRYLAHMLRRCDESLGRVFVADEDGTVVG